MVLKNLFNLTNINGDRFTGTDVGGVDGSRKRARIKQGLRLATGTSSMECTT